MDRMDLMDWMEAGRPEVCTQYKQAGRKVHLDIDLAGESLWNQLSEFGIGASVTMSVVYYVSSHGLGHAARSVQVLREIPASVSLHVKSGVPEWFFWQEVQRSFTFMHDVFDCGSLEVEDKGIDRRVTLQAY